MVGPSPDEQVREDNGDWNRRRRVWQMDPEDESQVPPSPSSNSPFQVRQRGGRLVPVERSIWKAGAQPENPPGGAEQQHPPLFIQQGPQRLALLARRDKPRQRNAASFRQTREAK